MNPNPMDLPSEVVDLKIAVLGKSLVGKSALTYRFINDKFPTEHDTTIEDQYCIPTQIDGIECKLEILDTAGQDDYQSMLDTWINSADGFILVYSIDDKGTTGYAILIAGNKCDLEDKRKVSRDEAENYCNGLKVDFLETSALQKINVKECFLCVAKNLLKIKCPEHYKEETTNQKKRCYCF